MPGGATRRAGRTRAGAYLLTILANPLNVRILRAHEDGPLRPSERFEKTGWPAESTLRVAIEKLCEAGLLARQQLQGPAGIATELSAAGRDALFAIRQVERWLAIAEEKEPLRIDSERGSSAIKSLAEGWNSKMIPELAYEPSSLTELARRIPEVSYPSLDRRFTRMRKTRQIVPSPAEARGMPFEVAPWLRHSVAPLCATVRCERRHMRDITAPITAVEVRAAFLMALPLAPLPEGVSGICVLAVLPEAGEGGRKPEAAGVTVEVAHGVVVRCLPEIDEEIQSWALGKPMDWLNAVIDGDLSGLSLGDGQPQLAAFLVNGLHLALFGEGA